MDSALPATTSAADLLLTRTPQLPGAKAAGAAKAHQAAQDFESVYLAQMLAPMFNTVEVDQEFGGGEAEETWRGIMVEELGKQIARSGGIGLAPVIEREMLRLQEVADGHKS